MYYLGIDTSCYTTSIALIDNEENLIADKRIMLKVKQGAKGLRQSEAFYQHIRNLDILLEDLFYVVSPNKIKAIGVSSKPRNYLDSYMPVFNSGLHIGNVIRLSLGIPAYLLSHQENHILAGLWSKKINQNSPMAAYHISGGTTELLLVEGNMNTNIEVIGGSSDLKAGQFIDRVGVAMGLKFPCGKEMDRLSQSVNDAGIVIPISIKESYASFSGPETFVQRIVKAGQYDKAKLSKAVFICIAKSIEETLINSRKKFEWTNILFIGGVSSNTIIKNYLLGSDKLSKYSINPIFAEGQYAIDNAVGGAIYAKKHFRGC
ncbi:tRNA (adenosine(37)-N6)-threonylcarbamoyltransferase complex transferase subunit TsaD [Lutispora thermophila]|uniref:N(6)-L-threonylcarbamoyladenine synthase n=1 Tax=Lutispora thermophila DSM 19022 TaxID=1122184 RepID=A0A1M6F5B2_9FIRM|nr:hypothetical protein [Lutispora thermophila]SHI92924.1 N6-L-threonylcarbamoyladenine synthase [Lutispora thermophila DSM 19022]